MNKIRVLIVDDHAIVRDSLRNLLQSREDMEVVGEAVDGSEAVILSGALNPHVVLMDISMPGIDGLEATRQIRHLCPDVKILALSMHDSSERLFEMLAAGAAGYCVKDSSSGELFSAIHTVSCGEVFLHPAVAKHLLHDYVQRAQTDGVKDKDRLTQHQRDILKLIAEGHTNQEVAALMLLKPTTVQWYRAHIMSVLGLRNHTELTKYALRKGIIRLNA